MIERDPMQLALNHAVSDFQAARARRMMAQNGSMVQPLDNKRPKAWVEYGFPSDITSEMLYGMWRRSGVANGAIGKIVGMCWKTPPAVIEGGAEDDNRKETVFDKDFAAFAKRLKLWAIFKEADVRRMACRYSVLILRYADNKQLDQPVDKRVKSLVAIVPVWADSIKVKTTNTNQSSEDYSEPTMWQYTETSGRAVDVHPDRVYVLGDHDDNACGFLEPAYNALVSLEKVEGGSGESFLKNASRQMSINFDPAIKLDDMARTYGVSLPDLKSKFDEATKAMNTGSDSLLLTQGAEVQTLVANVPDPEPTYNVNLQTVAAALDIPAKILVGQQTGDRASAEDREYFNNRCQSRRVDMETEITDLLQRVAAAGALALPAEISVIWDNLNESGPSDKLDNAKKMSDINNATAVPGEEPFTANEIRTMAGFMPDAARETRETLSE